MTITSYPIRISPAGFRFEERPEGLFLLGDRSEIERAAAMCKRDGCRLRETRETKPPGRYVVLIGSSDARPTWENCNSFGVHHEREKAWRYAMGAEVGSYEDPLAIEVP